MLFQMCPQVTEKGLNLSKFQFLHALKNVLLLFFFLHGKIPFSNLTFLLSRFLFCSKYQRKRYKPFQRKWVSFLLSFIRSPTSRLYKWQYFENVNSYQYLEGEKIRKPEKIYHKQPVWIYERLLRSWFSYKY